MFEDLVPLSPFYLRNEFGTEAIGAAGTAQARPTRAEVFRATVLKIQCI